MPMLPRRAYRSIWISDFHLGTRGAKTEHLIDFLRAAESDHLFLVGDIVDGWSLAGSLLACSDQRRPAGVPRPRRGRYRGDVRSRQPRRGVARARRPVFGNSRSARKTCTPPPPAVSYSSCMATSSIPPSSAAAAGESRYRTSIHAAVNTWLNRLRQKGARTAVLVPSS